MRGEHRADHAREDAEPHVHQPSCEHHRSGHHRADGERARQAGRELGSAEHPDPEVHAEVVQAVHRIDVGQLGEQGVQRPLSRHHRRGLVAPVRGIPRAEPGDGAARAPSAAAVGPFGSRRARSASRPATPRRRGLARHGRRGGSEDGHEFMVAVQGRRSPGKAGLPDEKAFRELQAGSDDGRSPRLPN